MYNMTSSPFEIDEDIERKKTNKNDLYGFRGFHASSVQFFKRTDKRTKFSRFEPYCGWA